LRRRLPETFEQTRPPIPLRRAACDISLTRKRYAKGFPTARVYFFDPRRNIGVAILPAEIGRPKKTSGSTVAGKFIQAAGGIVVRGAKRALFAVVQRSKDDKWVLPRGKLKRDENPVIGARREVVEETGHRVEVNEFLGAITYRAGGRPKVVQFWQMQAEDDASHDLMADIVAVEWLPLAAAVRRLSYPLEKLFLRNVGRHAAKHRSGHKLARKSAKQKSEKKADRKRNKKANRKADKRAGHKVSKTRRKRDNKRKNKKKR
jgi:8-oxo-dGTP diphosphatase